MTFSKRPVKQEFPICAREEPNASGSQHVEVAWTKVKNEKTTEEITVDDINLYVARKINEINVSGSVNFTLDQVLDVAKYAVTYCSRHGGAISKEKIKSSLRDKKQFTMLCEPRTVLKYKHATGSKKAMAQEADFYPNNKIECQISKDALDHSKIQRGDYVLRNLSGIVYILSKQMSTREKLNDEIDKVFAARCSVPLTDFEKLGHWLLFLMVKPDFWIQKLHTELSQTMLLMAETMKYFNLNIVVEYLQTHHDEKIGLRSSTPVPMGAVFHEDRQM